MCDQIPENTPIHYPDVRNPSQNPPGEKAPIPISRTIDRDINSLEELINQVRYLKRVARHWQSDPVWFKLKPIVIDWQNYLSGLKYNLKEFDIKDQTYILVRLHTLNEFLQ